MDLPISPSIAAPYVEHSADDVRLVAVDTFTGIGGITLAVAPFACSALYCEWMAFQQSVIITRMKDKKLDHAPIHSDIRTLKLSPSMKPDMIFGGPPCQDISTIGLQRGIVEGPKSSMFFEIIRLIDENPTISVVFLENVANILNLGLKEVVDTLSKRRFTMQWTVRTASAMGAPHQRKRWFMLACRGDGVQKLAPLVDRFLAQSTCDGLDGLPLWEGNEPPVRVCFKPSVRDDPTYDDHWAHRCQTMGNAVVPAVVRRAFIDLVQSAKGWATYADDATHVPSVKGVVYPFPENGLVFPPASASASASSEEAKLYVLPKPNIVPVKHNVQIIAPGSLVKKESVKKKGGKKKGVEEGGATDREAPEAAKEVLVVDGDNNEEEGETIEAEEVQELLYGRPAIRLSNYPTPRRGITHASTLSERSIRDLPTIAVYCKQTKDYLDSVHFVLPEEKALHQVLVPSPSYVEWIQGYNADWTKLNRDDDTLPAPLTRAAVARAKVAAAAATSSVPEDADAKPEATLA